MADPPHPIPTIGFLFIGGPHQMLHMAPVAAELQRLGQIAVTAFVRDATDHQALQELFNELDAEVRIETLPQSLSVRLLPASKVLRLIAARKRLGQFDILVAAERTSTILKRLPGRKFYMVHIPHGAGDRAIGFEKRISLFDHVIVAGPKDRDRMIAEGVVRPESCSISGYIKLAAVKILHREHASLFDDERPVVLYNPHFSKDLSSWDKFAPALLAAFAGDDRFNLIVAPHVRLAKRLSAEQRGAIEAKAVPGRIIVDFGSIRSSDMTYTMAADIYVGDVSSQVYEFASKPRPCVFLDARAADWRDDPNYAFWQFGEVIDSPAAAYDAIARAQERHSHYAACQKAMVRSAFGPDDGKAITRAADTLTTLARQRVSARMR